MGLHVWTDLTCEVDLRSEEWIKKGNVEGEIEDTVETRGEVTTCGYDLYFFLGLVKIVIATVDYSHIWYFPANV